MAHFEYSMRFLIWSCFGTGIQRSTFLIVETDLSCNAVQNIQTYNFYVTDFKCFIKSLIMLQHELQTRYFILQINEVAFSWKFERSTKTHDFWVADSKWPIEFLIRP